MTELIKLRVNLVFRDGTLVADQILESSDLLLVLLLQILDVLL